LLVEELLKSKLVILKKECDEFEKTLFSIPKRRVGRRAFTSWLQDETSELTSLIAKITKCITEELPASMGQTGVSGDAIKILRTVDTLFGYCRAFLDFELNSCAADPPSELKVFKTAFRGITRTAVGVIEELTDEWSRNIEGLRLGSHQFNIDVKFPCPPQLQKALGEINKIRPSPKIEPPELEPPASALSTAFGVVAACCRGFWQGAGVLGVVTLGFMIFAAYTFFGGTGLLVLMGFLFLVGLRAWHRVRSEGPGRFQLKRLLTWGLIIFGVYWLFIRQPTQETRDEHLVDRQVTETRPPTGPFTMRRNMWASGSASYTSWAVAGSVDECKKECARDARCKVFTYGKITKTCYFYTSANLVPDADFDSGERN
jgi:hypothetical protein